jgi:hypothetical protein
MPPDVASFRNAIAHAEFVYTPRPDPMAGDLRMSWGIAILLVALNYSRSKKSTFQKLQFLAHAVRVEEGREEVLGLVSGKYKPSEVSVRVEPALNRAVQFAHAMKLVVIEKGVSISLTDEGAKVAASIESDGDVLKEEIGFLKAVAPKMTDALMKRVWRLEDLL